MTEKERNSFRLSETIYGQQRRFERENMFPLNLDN